MIGEEVEIVDGYFVRVSDGEVIGLAEVPGVFRITTRDAADWVLGKIAEAEADILALEVRQQAVLANFARQRQQKMRRAEYLHYRFDGELAEFARIELAGKKSKTLALDNGKLAFRMSAGTNTIIDMGAAVAFVERVAPEDVRTTKTVTKTAALGAWTRCKDKDAPENPPWIEATGPRETFKIDTGIKAAGGPTARSSSESTGNSASTATSQR